MPGRIFGWMAALSLMALVACGGGGGGGTPTGELTDVQAVPRAGYVEVSWAFAGTANRFEVFRETVADGAVGAQQMRLIETIEDGDRRSYADTDVVANGRYRYAVAANGGAPVPAEGSGVSPGPGNTLRVQFGTAVPSGASVSIVSDPPGIDCAEAGASGCTARFASIEDVTLTASAEGLAASWENCDGSDGPTCTVGMGADRTVTVSFAAANTLAVAVQPAGRGTVTNQNALGANPEVDCSSSCTYDYPPGLIIDLRAAPVDPETYQLAQWDGACAGATGATCTVTMDGDRSVSAEFELIPPVVASFGASPARITTGESTTLSWTVTGGGDIAADELTISIAPDVGEVDARSGSVVVSPTETTDYVITASNASGTATDDVTVVVGDGALIESFTADPEAITPGQSSTLTWDVSGTGPITLTLQAPGEPDMDVTGQTSEEVLPDVTTEYTLVATNEFGSDTEQTTIRVGAAPEITAFAPRDAAIQPGEQTALEWTVTGDGEITLSIDQNVGEVTGDSSVPVSPTTTTSYTLTATSEFGTDMATTQVQVGNAPTIEAFDASADTIVLGEPVDLTWNVTGDGAIDVTITPEPGPVGTSGSATVSPAETTTYTLTADSQFGDQKVGTVTVNVVARLSVGVTPAGEGSVTSENDLGTQPPVDCSGSCTYDYELGTSIDVQAAPTDPGTYQFAQWGGACSASTGSTCTVVMNGNRSVSAGFELIPPDVASFGASPVQITTGNSTTLSWTVTGGGDIAADELTISIAPAVGEVAARSGSADVSPTETTVYEITATNASGTATDDVTVVVGDGAAIGSFTADPEAVTSGGSSTLEWTLSGTTPITLTLQRSGASDVNVTGQLSEVVTPTETTDYTLLAENAYGTDTAGPIQVQVGDAPTVTSLEAVPDVVLAGGTSTLTWRYTGSGDVELTLMPDGSNVTGSSSTEVTVDTTTTYTLEASSLFGTDQDQVTVDVGTAPSITGFSASDNTVTAGDPVELSWGVTGYQPMEVLLEPLGEDVSAVTTFGVTPSTTTEYRLIASNALDTVESALTVTVGTAPSVDFTVTDATITSDDTTTLEWTVSGDGTIDVELEPGFGAQPLVGTQNVSPDETTEYALTATSEFAQTSVLLDVIVGSAPVIESFAADPTTIEPGGTSTLSWLLSGPAPTALVIDPAPGDVAGQTETDVTPPETTTYTLTATNDFGASTAGTDVFVEASSPTDF